MQGLSFRILFSRGRRSSAWPRSRETNYVCYREQKSACTVALNLIRALRDTSKVVIAHPLARGS